MSVSPASSISAARPSRPRSASARTSITSSAISEAEEPMFYEPDKRDKRILQHDPFKAIVAPRPIGWITSMSAKGEINLAPYSFFNAVSEGPPMVMFSSGGPKATIAFVEETGEFVCNIANFALREAMSRTGMEFPRGVKEMIEAGLDPAPSRLVRPPRVAASPCALECKLLQIVDL